MVSTTVCIENYTIATSRKKSKKANNTKNIRKKYFYRFGEKSSKEAYRCPGGWRRSREWPGRATATRKTKQASLYQSKWKNVTLYCGVRFSYYLNCMYKTKKISFD